MTKQTKNYLNLLMNSLKEEDKEKAKYLIRIKQVNKMWREVVSDIIYKHTNKVYLYTEEGERKLIAYMDSSIAASELNAQRELIKYNIETKYKETINSFIIKISYGPQKKEYIYKSELEAIKTHEIKNRPLLNKEEMKFIKDTVSAIENDSLRKIAKKAMITNIQWENSKSAMQKKK